MMRISLVTVGIIVLGLAVGRTPAQGDDVARLPPAAESAQDNSGPQMATSLTGDTTAPATAAPAPAEQPSDATAACRAG